MSKTTIGLLALLLMSPFIQSEEPPNAVDLEKDQPEVRAPEPVKADTGGVPTPLSETDLPFKPVNTVLPVVPLFMNTTNPFIDRSRLLTAPPEFVVLNRINPAVFQPGTQPRQSFVEGERRDARLKSGRFVFHPGFTEELFYSDNFFGSTGNERTSWLLNSTPSFGLEYTATDNVRVVARGAFTQHEYLKDVTPNYFDASASGGVTVDRFLVDGLSFSLLNDYQQVGGTIVSPLAETRDLNNLEIVTGERYHTNTTPAVLRYKSDRAEMRLVYAYSLLDYFSRDSDANDNNQHLASFNGDYSILSKRLIAFTDYTFTRTRYPSDRDSDFDFSHFRGGFKGRLADLDYSFHAGFGRQEFLRTNTNALEPIYGGSLHYAFATLIDVRVFGERDFTAGVRTGGSKSTIGGGSIEFKTSTRSAFTLTHVYEGRSRVASSESTSSSTAAFRYRFGPNLESFTSFNYLKELLESDRQESKLFSQSISYRMGSRSTFSAAFSYEDRDRTDGTERTTYAGNIQYFYTLTSYATLRSGVTRTDRRDSRNDANFTIHEAQLGIQLTW